MHSITIRAGEVYGPTYDPTLEAAAHGIQIVHDIDADDAGEYDPATKTNAVLRPLITRVIVDPTRPAGQRHIPRWTIFPAREDDAEPGA